MEKKPVRAVANSMFGCSSKIDPKSDLEFIKLLNVLSGSYKAESLCMQQTFELGDLMFLTEMFLWSRS